MRGEKGEKSEKNEGPEGAAGPAEAVGVAAGNDAVRLLWGPRPKPGRGPKPGLDLDRIAHAGIKIADAEGLGGVSMQRAAALLGVTKMALYRYVPGKAEVIALMVDAAIGRPPEQDAAGATAPGWREELDGWARRLFDVFRLHPWLLEATVGPRVMGPAELGWMEQAVSALDGTGLTGAERMDAAVLLTGHVRAIAQQARAAAPTSGTEAQLGAVLGALLAEHGGRFPALTAALDSTRETGGQDEAWEFGLRRILDGLAVLIDQRPA
ncbi:TetR/AcrR family transcriptional regulator [Streptomyces varsoviensis]|uniref:TetR/AcrR family transcriptional regulator n=1 Tax=Streptomyces varsoviensis TaxID=67373 RepID=UPI000A84C4B6